MQVQEAMADKTEQLQQHLRELQPLLDSVGEALQEGASAQHVSNAALVHRRISQRLAAEAIRAADVPVLPPTRATVTVNLAPLVRVSKEIADMCKTRVILPDAV